MLDILIVLAFICLAIVSYVASYGYVRHQVTASPGRVLRAPLSAFGRAGSMLFVVLALLFCVVAATSRLSSFADPRITYLSCVGLAFVLTACACFTLFRPETPIYRHSEKFGKYVLLAVTVSSVGFTFAIVFALFDKAAHFFRLVPIVNFLAGTEWTPQAMRDGDVHAFGMVPLMAGTFLITAIALCVAVPLGLSAAIYLSEMAKPSVRNRLKPALELLSGVPTVVYGYLAATMIGPGLANAAQRLFGFETSSESALAAGLVMGVMIAPLVISLSDDALSAVPRYLRDGSFGMGATRAETIWHVILPAAMPGIIAAILLALSRAIGETMIVVMAAGLSANLTANPLEPVTTVTVQIVQMLTGDQSFDDPRTLSAFALGAALFVVTWTLNYAALLIVRRFKRNF
ncbi:MAG: phosphate ABC transporter permease subunit PstC [Rickettsiales bacterium]